MSANDKAYELGRQAAKDGFTGMKDQALYYSNYFDEMRYFSDAEFRFFEAGLVGAKKPHKVTGWRYGNIPAIGHSYNYRDDRPESGVSLMELDGDMSAYNIDEISTMFIAASGRPKVRVSGYLNTVRTGSDGEPLVFDAKNI
jgi:hypothetical protein